MKKPSKIRRVMNRSKFSEIPKGMIVIRRKNRERKMLNKVIPRYEFASITRDAPIVGTFDIVVNYR